MRHGQNLSRHDIDLDLAFRYSTADLRRTQWWTSPLLESSYVTSLLYCSICLFVFLGGPVRLNFLRSFLGFYPVYSLFSVSKYVVPNVFVLISISNNSHSYSISSGWSLQRKQVRPFSCEKKTLEYSSRAKKITRTISNRFPPKSLLSAHSCTFPRS